MNNNLFRFATSELSQDAFICWTANWFNDQRNPALHKMAEEFISLLSGIKEISEVKVVRQFQKIDVLLIVNQTTAVIVEDKTFTSEHDDQINRYEEYLKDAMTQNGYLELDGIRYVISNIVSVYLKTGALYPEDESNGNLTGIKKILRKDMLALTEKYKGYSEIVYDYWENLDDLDKWYLGCEENYHSGQFNAAFQNSYGQLICMKDLFQGKMFFEFSEQDIEINSASSRGRPYTWAWLWGRNDWYWLGYRLDSDSGGYCLALKQYRNYKKSPARDVIRQQKAAMFVEMQVYLKEHLASLPLKYVLGGNNQSYNESTLVKFYFKDNDIILLRKYLCNLAESMLGEYLKRTPSIDLK